MRKYVVAGLVVALGLIIATNVYAGRRYSVPDLEDNGRAYTDHYCPTGTEVVGVAYFDLRNDSVDAATAICEYTKGPRKGEVVIPKDKDWPSSGLREIQEHKCDWRTEKLWSIQYKDRDVLGKHRDAMDGLRVGCKNKKTGRIRYTYNADTQGGRAWETIPSNGNKIIGISYKDGACGSIKSDCADAVTFIFAN
jgi:hypothetical protein